MSRAKQAPGERTGKSVRQPSGKREDTVTIRSSHLTTCRVAEDGAGVGLEFVDQSGQTVVVELPLDQAEVVVMTLPHMLSNAVRRKTGNNEARYVFDLGEWVIESAKERRCLIATLKTPNGFEVSFAIAPEAGRSFGWILQHESSQAIEAPDIGAPAVAASRTKVN
jgi:hypothetical protein